MNTQSASTLISYIQFSRENLCKQLKYRGFIVDEYLDTSIEDIHMLYNQEQLDMCVENEDNTMRVYVKYFMDKSLRENHIQKIVEDVQNQENDNTKYDIIIVAKDEPNKSILGVLNHIYHNDGNYVCVRSIKSLQYNILEHELVPKHKQVEKDPIYKLYNIQDDSQVPEISMFDPAAQAIGLRPKQLCEITRKSKTAIYSKYYRICV